MASASAVLKEIGEDFLECGICFERYTNPKILSCVHSFCEKCLIKYYGNDEVKPCPLCRQKTNLPVPEGVSGLKTNGFLITLRDKVELQEKVAKTSDKARRTCELCTENEVTHHCLNCSQNICESCMKIHQRSKGMVDHTVGTIEDIRDGKVTLPEVEKEYTCNNHKGEISRFYCETCHVLICRDCTVVDHCKPDHQYIDRAVASFKYKTVLKELFPEITYEIENVKGCIKDANTAQQEFEKKVSHTEQEVKTGADWLRAKVKAEEDRILGEIRVLKKDRNTTFEEHLKSMESLIEMQQHMLTIATDVTNKGSDSDFLSLFGTINNNLTFLRSYAPPEIDAKCHYLRLDQTLTTGSIKLGELDLGDTKWELSREVKGDWREESTFKSVSYVAALRGDRLAVTTTRGRLVIFNTVGELEKIIKTNGCSYGGASFHNRLVVIYDSGNIQIYNEDFTPHSQIRTLRQGAQPKCVCMKKNGDILVGHSNMDVTFHSPNGTLKHTIALTKTPRFLATDSNDRVVVSGYDDNQVIVIDDQGGTVVAIQPTMNGQPVKYSRGVCCDGCNIYVAVSNLVSSSGHIHRYDGDGQFISCIVQGLHHPAGITFLEDGQHLAVADDNKVKIYHRI